MRQAEYINQLRRHLTSLSQSEVDDIVRDQEELIREAIASGRSEEDVIKGLGDPKSLGQALMAQSRIEQAQGSNQLLPKAKSTWSALIAFLALAPLNFFILMGPFFAAVMTIFTFWILEFVLVVVTVALLFAYPFKMFFVDLDMWAHASIIFGLLGSLGLSVIFGVVLVWISKSFLTYTLRYLKWNLKIMEII